jgi:hypothetical protein
VRGGAAHGAAGRLGVGPRFGPRALNEARSALLIRRAACRASRCAQRRRAQRHAPTRTLRCLPCTARRRLPEPCLRFVRRSGRGQGPRLLPRRGRAARGRGRGRGGRRKGRPPRWGRPASEPGEAEPCCLLAASARGCLARERARWNGLVATARCNGRFSDRETSNETDYTQTKLVSLTVSNGRWLRNTLGRTVGIPARQPSLSGCEHTIFGCVPTIPYIQLYTSRVTTHLTPPPPSPPSVYACPYRINAPLGVPHGRRCSRGAPSAPQPGGARVGPALSGQVLSLTETAHRTVTRWTHGGHSAVTRWSRGREAAHLRELVPQHRTPPQPPHVPGAELP